MSFEENEISINSFGGTEMIKRGLAERLDPELVKDFQIICSRVRKIEQDKIRIYWIHDLPEDPETSHIRDINSRNRFHKIVYCSNWQYSRFQLICGIPYDEQGIVIDNPIQPLPVVQKRYDKIRLVYTSTPQRGLSILVPVFEKLAEKYSNIHLDVFSSFKIYGWEETDKQYEPLYERIRNHPQMTYHGFVPNEDVKKALLESHIYAHPSIWMETSGRALIEAMSGGLLCVHPNYGGMVDTSGGLNLLYQGDSNPSTHARIFYNALDQAIRTVAKEDVQNYLKLCKIYADTRFSWAKIVNQWDDLLRDLADQYPTVESRKIPSQVFVYKTT